jgi:hypothetical protein
MFYLTAVVLDICRTYTDPSIEAIRRYERSAGGIAAD